MSSNEQKVVKPCSIDDLADEDLANIFKHLPPYERLLISQVSKRWYRISRMPWRDIVQLDLSPIPRVNIRVIVKQCPNLRTVFAKGKNFSWNQLQHLPLLENLSSVKLYQCLNVVDERSTGSIPLLSSIFSDNLSNAPWKELVLSNLKTLVSAGAWERYVIGDLPLSLERLQLNNVDDLILPQHSFISVFPEAYSFLNGLERLNRLTCLSLCASLKFDYMDEVVWHGGDAFEHLRGLTTLRELCISSRSVFFFLRLSLGLPRLEVLFVNNPRFLSGDGGKLGNLVTKHPALRILCITGRFPRECTIPVRRLYPDGFGADPVPKLHVFVGKHASEKIILSKSPADVLQIHPITERLPAFLEKEEIAPLFEGVWLAAQIKEGAKHGSAWWNSYDDAATSFRETNAV